MSDITYEFDPVFLSTVLRSALADEDRPVNQPKVNQWFPAFGTDSSEFVWRKGTSVNYTEAAPFRALDVPARLGTRPGATIARGEMPPISIAYLQREVDIIKARELAKEGTLFDPEDVGLASKQDLVRGAKAIRNRMWCIQADLLMAGSTTITDQGLSLSLDSSRDSTRSTTVGTPWSNPATCTPLNDEEDMLDILNDEQSLGPDDLVTFATRSTIREWKASEQVRNAYPSFRVLDQISMSAANEVRAENDLPMLVPIDAQVKALGGTVRKVITDGKWVYVPKSAAVGKTIYGTPAVVDMGIQLEADDRPGPVAFVVKSVNPPRVELVVDGIGVPVLEDPDSTACLTV